MTAPADRSPHPVAARPRPGSRPSLRLAVVTTPQPPLAAPETPLRLVRPGVASPRPAHRPGPRPHSATAIAGPDGDFGPQWSARADLPPVAPAAHCLFTLALEVLSGRRPSIQLRPLTSPRVYAALSGGRRPDWCLLGTAPLFLGRVHVCEPVDGVAEVSAVARRAGRAHAIAARLEGVDGRWRCTVLQIG